MSIRVTVNGKRREIEREMSLPEFLVSFDVDPRLVAVAINGDVVARDAYASTSVRAGDEIEVVRMVGGG